MEVSREDVLRCAKLANLRLEEAEIEPMRLAMAQLLTHAESLDAFDLDGVEPFRSPHDPALPRREDVPGPCFTQAEALMNAPDVAQGQFKVPKVL